MSSHCTVPQFDQLTRKQQEEILAAFEKGHEALFGIGALRESAPAEGSEEIEKIVDGYIESVLSRDYLDLVNKALESVNDVLPLLDVVRMDLEDETNDLKWERNVDAIVLGLGGILLAAPIIAGLLATKAIVIPVAGIAAAGSVFLGVFSVGRAICAITTDVEDGVEAVVSIKLYQTSLVADGFAEVFKSQWSTLKLFGAKLLGHLSIIADGYALFDSWDEYSDHLECVAALQDNLILLRALLEELKQVQVTPTKDLNEQDRRIVEMAVEAMLLRFDGIVRELTGGKSRAIGPLGLIGEGAIPSLLRGPVSNLVAYVISAVESTEADQVVARQVLDVGNLRSRVNDGLADSLPSSVGSFHVTSLDVEDSRLKHMTVDYLGRLSFLGSVASVAATAEISEGQADAFELVVPRFKADLRFGTPDTYEGVLEYGYDEKQNYNAGRGRLVVKDLLEFEVFLLGLTSNGFVALLTLGVGKRLPVTIPIGSSGFALKRVRGHFAQGYQPTLALDDQENLSAAKVRTWIDTFAVDPWSAWKPASDGHGFVGGFGLSADFITLPDNGYLMELSDTGFGYFTQGPTVYFSGEGKMLSTNSMEVVATGVIQPRLLRMEFSAAAHLEVPADGDYKVISASGVVASRISLKDVRDWYLHVGTRERPIRGELLNRLLAASVYFMVDSESIATGGTVSAGKSLMMGPFSVSAFLGMYAHSQLGWNPVQFTGAIGINGSLRACLFRGCLGLSAGGRLFVTVPRPTEFWLTAYVTFHLPWPLSDVSASGTILRFNQELEAKDLEIESVLRSPLALLPSNLSDDAEPMVTGSSSFHRGSQVHPIEDPTENPTENSSSLGAFHHLTGRQWDLGPFTTTREPIWPDAELVIPFTHPVMNQIPGTKIPIVYPTMTTAELDDPTPDKFKQRTSGGYRVMDVLTRFEIHRLHEENGVEGLEAVWAGQGRDDEPQDAMGRLHVPAFDPFAWMHTMEEFAANARGKRMDGILTQDFGHGEQIEVTQPIDFGWVRIESPQENAARVRVSSNDNWNPADREFPLLESLIRARVESGDSFKPVSDLRGITLEQDLAGGVHMRFRDERGAPIRVSRAAFFITTNQRLDDLPDFVARLSALTEEDDGSLRLLDKSLGEQENGGDDRRPSSFWLELFPTGAFTNVWLESENEHGVEWYVTAVRLFPAVEELPSTTGVKRLLTPGSYRLSIEGFSTATLRNVTAGGPDNGAWGFTHEFYVIPVDSLRPYVLNTTAGDSRIFGAEAGTWNPTPYGIGFPAYRGHQLRIRFKTHYVEQMLSLANDADSSDGTHGVKVHVRTLDQDEPTVWEGRFEQSQDGSSMREISREYYEKQGISPPPDEELVVDDVLWGMPPMEATLAIVQDRPVTDGSGGTEQVKLDEWRFTVSRFASVKDHLSLGAGETGFHVIDQFASARSVTRWDSARNTRIKVGDTEYSVEEDPWSEVEAGNAAESADEWPVLQPVISELLGGNLGSGLTFVQVAHRLGIVVVAGLEALDGLLTPTEETKLKTTVTAVKDLNNDELAVALLLRTPEPLDWRRITANAVYAPLSRVTNEDASNASTGTVFMRGEGHVSGLKVECVPSPDATAVMLFLHREVTDDVFEYMYWPLGLYKLNFDFALKASDLPTHRLSEHVEGRFPDFDGSIIQTKMTILLPTGRTP